MVTKEEIKREVDRLPENLLDEVYDYLKNVAGRRRTETSEEEDRKRWDDWWDNLNNFSPDFMNERVQPPTQIRENMFD